MGETSKQHLSNLLRSFDTGFLISHSHGEQEHARPMAVAAIEGADTIWFVTAQSTPKAWEIEADARVAVTFQSASRFVALSGRARLIADRARIAELWKPAWKVWFPKGRADPDLRLVRVTVMDAEFWDNAGSAGIKYVASAARALVTGKRPEPSGDTHGRVQSPESTAGPSRH